MCRITSFRASLWLVLVAIVSGGAPHADPNRFVEARGTGSCVWDGTHDVAPCIQAAVTAASGSSGAWVHIPAGKWSLGTAINVPSNVNLQGDAGKTILIPAPGNRSNPVLLGVKTGAKDVIVRGITFEGGGDSFPNDKPIIAGTSVTHVLFEHITVQDTRGVGLLLQGGTSNSGVRHSVFVNVGNHWKTSMERSDRLQAVVFCCGTGNLHNFANDNIFKDIGLDALHIGDQDGFVATNNTFDLSNDQFVRLRSGDYPAGIFALQDRDVLIADNTIRNAPGNGIDAPGLQNATIKHNTILGSGSAGIGIFIGYDKKTQSHDVAIVDNTIMNNVHWKQASFLGGITISGGTPSNITISHNVVTDNQAVKTQQYGVFVRPDASPNNLKITPDNQLAGNLAGPSAIGSK